jgi:hypothetical protein
MTSDFLGRILLSPVYPITLNIISYMTDVEERKKQNNKNKNKNKNKKRSAVNMKFYCNLKEGILQFPVYQTLPHGYKYSIYWTIKK